MFNSLTKIDRRTFSPDEPAAAPVADPAAPADPVTPEAPAEPAAEPETFVIGQDPAAPAAEAPEAKDGEAPAEPEKPADAPAPLDLTALKPPEGYTALDTAALEAIAPDIEALGLDQAGAQKLMDMAGKVIPQMLKQQIDSMVATRDAEVAAWAKACLTHPEIGPTPQEYAANVALADKALRQFATPQAITMLKDTGLANNPEVVAMFVKIGKAVAEDRVEVADAAAQQKRPLHEKAYGEAFQRGAA